MPYKIEKRGDQYCVINTDSGENKGCSKSQARAVAHMRVLYGVKSGWKPTQKKAK